MSAKKALKATFQANPHKSAKDTLAVAKRDFKHKPPTSDTTGQEELLEQQRLAQAGLDEEENRRRKRFLSASQGIRAYSGSPMFRSKPGNRAGTAAAAVSPSSAVAASARSRMASGGARIP